VASWLVLCTACTASLESVRTFTYPPDFHYITAQQIHTTMGALATEVDALDQIMWQPNGPLPEDQARVVAILSQMQTLAHELMRREHSNHPRIDEHAPELQRDIQRALAASKMQPPNYYYAGVVSAACTYCHAPRHRLGGSTLE
jgi:hypothetical protein